MMEKPKLLVIAGPNGAGKTSVTGKILQHRWVEGCEYINPDFIARDVFGDWNSTDAVLKAARYAKERRTDCISRRSSLLFETVLSAPDKLNFIREARQKGYFVRLFFIGTDSPQINAARVVRRVMSGGHDVPTVKIISRYYKSIGCCARLAAEVDRLYVYDNSVDGAFPQLLFRAGEGKLIRQYADIRDWATIIFRAVRQ